MNWEMQQLVGTGATHLSLGLPSISHSLLPPCSLLPVTHIRSTVRSYIRSMDRMLSSLSAWLCQALRWSVVGASVALTLRLLL